MSPISKALGLVTYGLTRHTCQQMLLGKNQKLITFLPATKLPYKPATIRQFWCRYPGLPKCEGTDNDSDLDPPSSKMKEQVPISKSGPRSPPRLTEQEKAIFDEFKAITKNYTRAETLAKLSELDRTGFFTTTDGRFEQAIIAKDLAKYGGRYFTPAQMAIGEELGYALFQQMAADIEKRKRELEKAEAAEHNTKAEWIKEAEKMKAGRAKGIVESSKFKSFRCHVCFSENMFRRSQEHQLIAESGYNCFYCAHECMECAECEKKV